MAASPQRVCHSVELLTLRNLHHLLVIHLPEHESSGCREDLLFDQNGDSKEPSLSSAVSGWLYLVFYHDRDVDDPVNVVGLSHYNWDGDDLLDVLDRVSSTVFCTFESQASLVCTTGPVEHQHCNTGTTTFWPMCWTCVGFKVTRASESHTGTFITCSENCNCCTSTVFSIISIVSARRHELRLRCLDTLRDVWCLFL